jgi:FtsZ-binding cell division protein ZapB
MSSTFLSNNALQLELNECKEKERKLQEEIYSLRKVSKKKCKKIILKVKRYVFTAT